MDSQSLSFVFRHVQETGHRGQAKLWLARRVYADVPRIVASLGPPYHGDGCLVSETGDFVLQMMQVLSQLAELLVKEDVQDHLQSKAAELLDEGELIEARGLEQREDALRRVTERLNAALAECEDIWQRCPRVGVEAVTDPMDTTAGEQFAPEMAGPPDESHQASLWSDMYKERGRGEHYCPMGLDCTKGGLNNDGTPRNFPLNSEFRAHMQKHEKPFRCDLPGCTNTTGFARIDQLERHKAKVKHGPQDFISHNPSRSS